MHARKHQGTWDSVDFIDADAIAAWGAFEGYVGAIEFGADNTSKIHIEHDQALDVLHAIYHWAGHLRTAPVRSSVSIERRPCRFGGTRAYFRCPLCGRTTLRLAVIKAGLRCGRCGRITWASRREGRTQRLVRKAWLLAGRLELEHYLDQPVRPRYMHRKTFSRLCDQLAHINAEIERDVGVRLERLTGSLARLRYLSGLGL